MTDAEITKLCAQACCEKGMLLPQPGFCAAYVDGKKFKPLKKYKHAMVLIRDFYLTVQFSIEQGVWRAEYNLKKGEPIVQEDVELIRAICKCVAHMQAEKNKNHLLPGTS